MKNLSKLIEKVFPICFIAGALLTIMGMTTLCKEVFIAGFSAIMIGLCAMCFEAVREPEEN